MIYQYLLTFLIFHTDVYVSKRVKEIVTPVSVGSFRELSLQFLHLERTAFRIHL